jgi:hypothetical protein
MSKSGESGQNVSAPNVRENPRNNAGARNHSESAGPRDAAERGKGEETIRAEVVNAVQNAKRERAVAEEGVVRGVHSGNGFSRRKKREFSQK